MAGAQKGTAPEEPPPCLCGGLSFQRPAVLAARLTTQITLLAPECFSCEATGLSAFIRKGGAEDETQILRVLSRLMAAQECLAPSRSTSAAG